MPNRFQTTLLIFAAAFGCGDNAACGQTMADEDEWQEWQMTITPQKFQRYLDYPGSKLHPLTKVTVTYMQPPNTPLTVYEDLYYTNSQAVGCKRQKDPITIKPGTAGIIKISGIEQNQSYAAANAVLRVFLDVSLRQCMTKYIQVPYDSFDNVVMSLCNLGMHRHRTTGPESGVTLQIVADKGGQSVILFQ